MAEVYHYNYETSLASFHLAGVFVLDNYNEDSSKERTNEAFAKTHMSANKQGISVQKPNGFGRIGQ